MFQPVNALEHALVAADPEARPAFSRAFLEGAVLVGLHDPVGAVAPENLVCVKGPDGAVAAVVLTSAERAAAIFDGTIALVEASGRAVLESRRGSAVVVNPNCDYGVAWSAADIDALLDGVTTEIVRGDTSILLGHPKERPDALIAALARELGALEGVKGAWLLLAHRADKREPSFLLGVDHAGDWAPVSAAIGRAVTPDVLGGRYLDAIPLESSPLSRDLRGGIPIIAPKRRGLLSFFR